MNIKERYNHEDHPFWKRVGNFAAIVAAPAGTLVILILVPDPYKQAAVATWSAIMAGLKGFSKLTVNK